METLAPRGRAEGVEGGLGPAEPSPVGPGGCRPLRRGYPGAMTVSLTPQERPTTRPPRVLSVVNDPTEIERAPAIDWSAWRLTDEDDEGQSPEHSDIVQLLYAILALFLGDARRPGLYVGVDAFFGWVPADPLVRISPDVYVVADPPQPLPKSFQTWRPGHAPPLCAVEVVSEDWRKDYEDLPSKYALLGAHELIVFDPDCARGPVRDASRRALQLYRRGEDGLFVRVEAGPGPVWSRTLEVGFVAVAAAEGPRLRLSYDRDGLDLVPSPTELAAAERARAEAAEAELAALRAELARLRGA